MPGQQRDQLVHEGVDSEAGFLNEIFMSLSEDYVRFKPGDATKDAPYFLRTLRVSTIVG